MIEPTPAGPQHVLDGCEPLSTKQVLEAQWRGGKRSKASPVRGIAYPGPLFSDDARQLDLIEAIHNRK